MRVHAAAIFSAAEKFVVNRVRARTAPSPSIAETANSIRPALVASAVGSSMPTSTAAAGSVGSGAGIATTHIVRPPVWSAARLSASSGVPGTVFGGLPGES